MKPQKTKNIPTILVAFGATGDLMSKKIVPALFHLFNKRQLPRFFKIVGFSRRDLSDKEFQNSIIKIISKRKDIKASGSHLNSFYNLFSYQQGKFSNKDDYQNLNDALSKIDKKWGVCSNKLFYLAVPPQFYEVIFNNVASSGLTIPCGPEEGWTRVIVEKPFGKDLKSAQQLDNLLNKLFKESQLYRIDHYLAKEMLQNILTFRFSNNIFKKSWDNKLIERIDIKLLERIGVEDRGSFYDDIGALRDVGQNHLLQMLALITMEHPGKFDADSIREKRREILDTLHIPSQSDIKKDTLRAQYKGYRSIKGVNPHSKTETYFKLRASLTSPRWEGVPITLESGKRFKNPIKDITLTFRHPAPCLCPPDKHYNNKIIFHLEPKEGIAIQFWSKKPGLQMEIEERRFDFLYRSREQKSQYTEEYEKLLLDCIAGDQTLFVSTNEIKAMWKFIDPIIRAWQKNLVPLKTYEPNSDMAARLSRAIPRSIPVREAIKKEVGIIGLGKMGGNLARQLLSKKWKVAGFNRNPEVAQKMEREGLAATYSLNELVDKLPKPRVVWLMIEAGKAVDGVIDKLIPLLERGDIIVDGGNSFYKDSIARYKKLKKRGVHFIDAGVSGGPRGALEGASIMIGGERKIFEKLESLFHDMAIPNGYQFFEGPGSGHFIKMVHNGIEYGMMQALAEGFAIMKKYSPALDLKRVANIYNHGSVIESRLVGWLENAFEKHGKDLKRVSGSVMHTGEGEWTVKTAKKLKIKTPVIKDAFNFRVASAKKPNYIGKILSALRNQFGGHSIK